MRQSISRPLLYLATVGALMALDTMTRDFVLFRGVLMIITLPWTVVLYFGVGFFGVMLPGLMSNEEAGVLAIGAALIQAAVLSYLGARQDAKAPPPPGSTKRVVIALGAIVAAPLLLVGYGAFEQHRADVAFREAESRPIGSMEQREQRVIHAINALLRAEYEWAAAHPGKGYATSLKTLAPPTNAALSAELAAIERTGYTISLRRREGWFGRATTFRIEAGPTNGAPFAKGYYADESGVLHVARVRETPGPESDRASWPPQSRLIEFTPDGSAILIGMGVRILVLDARNGGVRDSVLIPRDFLDLAIDSTGRPIARQMPGTDEHGNRPYGTSGDTSWFSLGAAMAQDSGEVRPWHAPFTRLELARDRDLVMYRPGPDSLVLELRKTSLVVMDLKTGQQPSELAPAAAGIAKGGWTRDDLATMLFSPDGKSALTFRKHGSIRLWDVATGKVIRAWELRGA